MDNPVLVTKTGQVYDEASIREWIRDSEEQGSKKFIDPMTGTRVPVDSPLIPVFPLKSLIARHTTGSKRKRNGSEPNGSPAHKLAKIDLKSTLSTLPRDHIALFVLGKYYLSIKSFKCAQICLSAAADLGHRKATFLMWICYNKGLGVEKCPSKAFGYLLRAAQKHHPAAEYNLAKCYCEGYGVEKDKNKADVWYAISAKHGDPTAQVRAGDQSMHKYHQYTTKCSRKKDQSTQPFAVHAVEWYTKAAQQNFPWGQYKLARSLLEGIGCRRNMKSAMELFTKAYNDGKGVWLAGLWIGYCHYHGKTGKSKAKNYIDKACQYYTAEAEKGHLEPQRHLALLCLRHKRSCSNGHPAVYWFKKASNQNDSFMQFLLSQCYLFSMGGAETNVFEGVRWMKESAKNGQKYAQSCLGLLTEKGIGGIEKNSKEAIKWYAKAAHSGCLFAIFRLGILCQRGVVGTTNDVSKAKLSCQKVLAKPSTSKYRFIFWAKIRKQPYWQDHKETEWGSHTPAVYDMISLSAPFSWAC